MWPSAYSLAWPDRFSSYGAYRLEIISACSEKGLVQNQYTNLFSHPKPELGVFNKLSSQNVYFLLNFKPSMHWKSHEIVPVAVMRYTEVCFLRLKRTQIKNKKITGELSKESFWLYKTNLTVSQNHYRHLFIAFPMCTWLEM